MQSKQRANSDDEMPPYSYWQILKIRAALIDQARYGDNGRGMSDARLASEIAAWAEIKAEDDSASVDPNLPSKEVKVGKEAVRRFKNGTYIDDRTGRLKEPDAIHHIAHYLTHPDVDALDPVELQHVNVPYIAPLRLAQFLDPEPALPLPQALNGIYRTEVREGDNLIRKYLSIAVQSDGVLLHIEELTNGFDISQHGPPSLLSQHERVGWGILTSEDFIFVFLKNIRLGTNAYYFSFAQVENFWADGDIEFLIFSNHSQAQQELSDADLNAAAEVLFKPNNSSIDRDIRESNDFLSAVFEAQHLLFEKTRDEFLQEEDLLYSITTGKSLTVDPSLSRKNTGSGDAISSLRRSFRFSPFSGKDIGALDEKELQRLGRRLLKAAELGDPTRVSDILEAGAPVNFADPKTGNTALHVLAAGRARDALRVLIREPDLVFWVRNNAGRLPSELANMTTDTAMGRLLMIHEAREARVEGIAPRRRQDVPLPPEL